MDIINYAFFQNALIGVIIISIASAIIGTYIVTRRMVFITGGITHACFGGLGLGYFMGINPLMMAGLFAVSSSLGVEWLSSKQKVREDSAIAVVWALGMALGTLFIFLSPGYVPELTSFLFGNILTITSTDLWLFALYTIVLLAFFILLYRPIIACSFDRDFAHTMHLPEKAINYTMTVLIALCIVLTIRLIGVMLLMSVLTLPQMTSEIYCHRFKPMMILSVIVCSVCSVCGLLGAYFIDVPASATIVILLILVYGCARIHKNIMRNAHQRSNKEDNEYVK